MQNGMDRFDSTGPSVVPRPDVDREPSRILWHGQRPMAARYAPDGNLTYVNDAYCHYHMLPREQVLGKNFIHRVPLDDFLRVSSRITMLSPLFPEQVVLHGILLPDGRIRRHLWLHRALFARDGGVDEYLAVGLDVSQADGQGDLEQAEMVLQQCRGQLCREQAEDA